ncbi:MAG: molybdopterin molybdenumtransferase MoeA [Curvibacter sp.]|nr:MAG: molybdopterin molybdenumtransferase MoeA [Curvibacter sp.]
MSTAPRKPLLPLDDALAQLLASVQPLGQTESVSTTDADGRVLAQVIVSGLQVPPCDNSAMDGYAVCVDDVLAAQGALPVSQRIAAGSVGTALQPGTVARIFTGAPVPPGADAVVMQEECAVVEAPDAAVPSVQINSTPLPGQNIRRSGEDVSRGDVVLAAGTRLGPAALGLAASVGMAQLQVVRKPRVALFSTGDELVLPGTVPPEQMPPGAIYNSNRFFLSAMLRRLGCEVTDLGIVPDRLDATVQALQHAAASHDLVLTSGGVSVGEEDHIKPAVQSLGQLDLWQIAIKPGKPFAHGRVGAAHFIGLPGNPVSSFVTFVLLVRPFLLRLQGVQDVAMKSIASRADFDWPRAEKRREFLRVRRNDQGGLDLFTNQSSGVLTSAVWGDGLIDTPPGEAIQYGATVRYIPFSELLA